MRSEKGIISTNQYIWMLFVLVASVTNFLAPEFLMGIAGRDAWLSVLGGWFLDVLLALVYAYMGIRFAGQNFVQYSETILGKYLGKLVGLVFSSFFLLVCTILMSGLSHLINIMFLPRTPFGAIVVAGFILIVYAARQGLEVSGRAAELVGPVYLLSIIALVLLIFPRLDINLLKPQFEQGIRPFLLGTPFILSFFGICIIMAMFIPHCNRPENGFLGKFASVSLGAFVIGSIVVASVAALGYQQTREKPNPGLALSGLVVIGRFWERVEIVWMVIAIGSGILAATTLLWAFSLGCAQVASLPSHKALILPAALISIITCLVSFDEYMALANFVHYVFPMIAMVVESGLELLLFALALILRRRPAAM